LHGAFPELDQGIPTDRIRSIMRDVENLSLKLRSRQVCKD